MKIGRNAPCPCGSGKKYKVCCLRLDRANRGVPGGAPIRAAATRAEVWQADIVPIPIAFEDQPEARPAAMMVTAAEFVVFTDILSRPSPEVDDLAAEIESGILTAITNVDAAPKEIAVREPAVAVALAERLADHGHVISVTAAPLPDLDRAAASLIREMGGSSRQIGACHPASWRAWGQSDEWIAQLFALCADYYRAEPWKIFDDFPPILALTAEDRGWVLSVLGSAGVEYGLAFYSDPEDYRRVIEGQLGSYSGRVLGLTFDNAARLGRTMRKEVARAGWQVATPDAYPVLLTIGCPAGGLRSPDAEDLARVVAALTSWVEATDRNPNLPHEGPWRDPATGVELEWAIRDSPTDRPTEVLEPGDAQGPGAEPELRIDPERLAALGPESREEDWLRRFQEDLAQARLKSKTARYHTENVYLFLDFLANWAGIPVRSLHEYDLRTFLFDWYPRKVAVSRTEASRVPTSLRRFFKMLDQAGISCPWAFPILKEKDHFLARWDDSPGGAFWEADTVDWREAHFIDLELRAMTPSHEVPGILTWGEYQGMNEARLWNELQDRWLFWRDELIRSGIDQADELAVTLRQNEAQWLTTTHPQDGKTPVEMIEAERAQQQRVEED